MASVPLLNPCDTEYSDQGNNSISSFLFILYPHILECIQTGYKTTGPKIGRTLRNIQNWQQCQTECRRTSGCEWFSYIGLAKKCVLRKSKPSGRTSRSVNTRPVTLRDRGRSFYSGSIMSSDTASPNCLCPNSNRYETTTMERNRGWGWGSWSNPCPVGNRQTQNIMGRGVIQCCPLEEGSDGTPVCEY